MEFGCRLPEEFRAAEADFRQAIARLVRRGKVDCSLHFRPTIVATSLEVDAELLGSLTLRAREVAAQAGTAARIDVLELLRWPGVVRDAGRDTTPLIAAAHELLAEALTELTRFRDSEGGRLRDALEQRCAALIDLSGRVAERLPGVRARTRAKLLERVAALVAQVDHDRLEQELGAAGATSGCGRGNRSAARHVSEVRQTFGDQEPAGRRLDFLMQELNREAIRFLEITGHRDHPRRGRHEVLIEQMREQVQNVE